MKLNLRVCVLFFGLLSIAFCDIDFHECDLHDVEIERVDVEECMGTPCRVLRGRTYTILVHPDERTPPIDEDAINVSARALIRGASFPVNAYAVNSASRHLDQGPELLEIKVLVTSALLRGPAPLIINATYLHRGVATCRFCFEFDVDIF